MDRKTIIKDKPLGYLINQFIEIILLLTFFTIRGILTIFGILEILARIIKWIEFSLKNFK